MDRTIPALTVCLVLMTASVLAQHPVSIMVAPYADADSEALFNRMQHDEGYIAAISVINSALIGMGYQHTLDLRTLNEVRERRRWTTEGEVKSDRMKDAIEYAPVDVLIETAVVWTDPPGDPASRQVKLRLKAVDKYTGAIYADDADLVSEQREFPDLAYAVNHLLKEERSDQFKAFLQRMETSYEKVVRDGRSIQIKFEVCQRCTIGLSDRVGADRLSDKIEECIRTNAFKHQYSLVGESDNYMDLTVQVPVTDETGASVTPGLFIRKKVDDYFYQLGFETKCMVMGGWISIILKKRV